MRRDASNLANKAAARWQAELEEIQKMVPASRWQAEQAKQAKAWREQLIAEKLREAEARITRDTNIHVSDSPAQPPQLETPKRKRKTGGGNKPKLTEQQIERGKETYRGMLDEDPKWAESQEASATRVLEMLQLGVSWWTVRRWIVAPVLKQRRAK